MEKILSIVIPTYNMEKYLDRCLTSLIVEDEKMDLLEVLVVIDGAKDRSSEIAHTYEAKYPQTFRVIDKENGNYGSCINRGLAEAAGKYIKVLDADDWFSAEFSSYLDFLTRHDVDLVLSNFDFINSFGNIGGSVQYDLPADVELEFHSLLPEASNIWMHAVAYRTDMVRGLGYRQTEGISYTDQEWIFFPMSGVKRLCLFNKQLYQYLVGREGQTIDPAVWIKSSAQEMKSAAVMLDQYDTNKRSISEDVRTYWETRIQRRSQFIYQQLLIVAPVTKEKNYYGLRDYDNLLKTKCPTVYNLLDTDEVSKKIHYTYIHGWRSMSSIATNRLKLIHLAKRIRNMIFKISGK